MAYEPRRWALGLVPLVVLWGVGTAIETGTVETDLANRSADALGANWLAAPELHAAGRDVGVVGAAFAPSGAQSAVEAVLGVTGVRLVDVTGLSLVPEAKPYVWSATRDGANIALAGGASDPGERAAVTQAAKAIAGAKVADGMSFRRGDTGPLGAGAVYALGELAYLSKGAANLSDNVLTLSGEAIDAAGYEKAIAGLHELPSGVTLAKAEIAPPLVAPYVFSASSAGGVVKLTGEAPSIAERDALVAAAAALFPGAKIENALTIARGAPAGDFDAAAKFALAALANLSDGKATLTDASLYISGAARRPGDVEALEKNASSLASGYRVAMADVAPALVHPFVLGIAKSADGVHLTGFAPDAAAHQLLRAGAAKLAAGQPVTDEALEASGLPAGVDFNAVVALAVAELSKLVSGEARLLDANFSLRGVAADDASADQAQAGLAALPSGVTLAEATIARPAPVPAAAASSTPVAADAVPEASGPPLDVDACDAGFKTLLNEAHIEFDTDKSSISASSQMLIRRLAAIALRCQVANIEISGHTDNQGDDALNLGLSKDRADAVVALLVGAGVPAERLTAVGYGSSRPIASNDTEEGRAKNRRIEFSVKP